jgi:hypothetical protein
LNKAEASRLPYALSPSGTLIAFQPPPHDDDDDDDTYPSGSSRKSAYWLVLMSSLNVQTAVLSYDEQVERRKVEIKSASRCCFTVMDYLPPY